MAAPSSFFHPAWGQSRGNGGGETKNRRRGGAGRLRRRGVGFQAVRFFVVSIASLGRTVLEALLRDHAVGELTAQAIAVAAAMPLNFLGNKLWAFA
jgi:hypothetical protein